MNRIVKTIADSASPPAGSESSDLATQARQLEVFYPIFYWAVVLLAAYFLLYFLTVFVGPALFGTRPYGPFYKRSSNDPMMFGAFRGFDPNNGLRMHPEEAQRLSQTVAQAIKQ